MKVLALIDMDSFYTQVEVKLNPSLRGQPLVVVQYNPYGDLRTLKPTDVRLFPDSNGSIIAASYEARKYGVKRNMMAQAAKKLCPELKIVQVPVAHGKADIGIYREAGAQVITVLSSGAVCERASVDEAYLDVTAAAQQMVATAAAAKQDDNILQQQKQQDQPGQQQADQPVEGQTEADTGMGTSSSVLVPLPESVEGWHTAGMTPGSAGVEAWWQRPDKTQDDQLLAAGAVIVARLRAAVAQQLGFTCSAGIAHSKILAKLGAGLNKPAQQTLVPAAAVEDLLNPLPISKLRALGGKFGEEIATSLGISTVGELAAVPASRLEAAVGEESAAWLARLAQGIDDLDVKPRTLPKSISCGKTFRGVTAITGLSAVHKWLQELGKELQERIEADRKDHQRLPGLLTMSIDTLPGGSGAAAATGGAATAAVAASVGQNAAAAVAANGGRHTAQTWRAGAVNVSRSCNLRRPVAEVMAEDALKLVKKWARDRSDGWKIIGMFLNASNFVAAPTGASTLERFMAPGGPQQQQQHMDAAGAAALDGQSADAAATAAAAVGSKSVGSSSSPITGSKRGAAAAARGASHTRSKKRAYGDLRAFLGPSTNVGQSAAAAATTATAAQEGDGVAALAGSQSPGIADVEPQQRQRKADLADDNVQQEQQQQQNQPVELLQELRQQQHQQQAPGAPLSAAAVPATVAAATSSSAAGQAPSVLTALSRLAPAVATAAHLQNKLQQQQQPKQEGTVHGQPQQLQPEFEGHEQGAAQQHLAQQQQPQQAFSADEPAPIEFAPGYQVSGDAAVSQQQPPLQIEVVGSLSGWIGTPRHSQQQHQDQQQLTGVQQQQPAVQLIKDESLSHAHGEKGVEFEFPSMHRQEDQQPDDAHQSMNPLVCERQHLHLSPQHTASESDRARDVAEAPAAPAAAARGDVTQQQPALRMSEIDPSVLAELPYHIQQEVRRAAGQRLGSSGTSSSSNASRGRGVKQQQRGQQSGSIAKYFGRSK